MLPDNPDLQTLLKTFRRHLAQYVDTISGMTPGRKPALFIDAESNTDFTACQPIEDCVSIELIISPDTEPIAGLKLIVSC
jgi:hypothetical protein